MIRQLFHQTQGEPERINQAIQCEVIRMILVVNARSVEDPKGSNKEDPVQRKQQKPRT